MGKKKATPKAKKVAREKPKAQSKQPKITKPVPKQGRGKAIEPKETGVIEVEVRTQRFPFWAKLKIGGKHPTLVIDEDMARDKQRKNKLVPGFVHREATHSEELASETIFPNPDTTDPAPMYLKRPDKKPKRFFAPMDKEWSIPEHLQKRYEKNNNKDK